MASNTKSDEVLVDSATDAEFSKLFHESFTNRQRYEWRFNFTIWGGSVVLASAAITNPEQVSNLAGGWGADNPVDPVT